MKRLFINIALAIAATLPGIFVRLAGFHLGPISTTIIFFIALLSAGLLLSWGVEAAEKHVAKGLAIAVLALITVLPEYAVDIYYSYQAGNHPGSEYVGFAAANMTGANRLLVGMAWPLIVLLYWWRSKKKGIELHRENITEIGFLALSSLYAFVIVLKSRIDIFDTIVLVAIYFLYLWRVSKGAREEAVEEAEVGPSAALTKLPKQKQYLIIICMAVYAAFVILLSAEPFAESLIASGESLGFNKFLLIQWLAPLASEAPTVIVMILMTLALLPTSALSALISDKINQWTLLVGMIPLAYSIGLGRMGHLPLDARQGEEFFLTAAQSLFALSLLLCLRLSLKSAFALLALFLVQLVIAFIYSNDEPKTIVTLTWLSWIYLALTVVVTFFNRKCLMNAITQWTIKKPDKI
ncbi:MAG: sodium:proton exchanger [Sphingobacteriales bacterium]|nr:sodium:proton exchanger [Sphingobacteriales bacterium]